MRQWYVMQACSVNSSACSTGKNSGFVDQPVNGLIDMPEINGSGHPNQNPRTSRGIRQGNRCRSQAFFRDRPRIDPRVCGDTGCPRRLRGACGLERDRGRAMRVRIVSLLTKIGSRKQGVRETVSPPTITTTNFVHDVYRLYPGEQAFFEHHNLVPQVGQCSGGGQPRGARTQHSYSEPSIFWPFVASPETAGYRGRLPRIPVHEVVGDARNQVASNEVVARTTQVRTRAAAAQHGCPAVAKCKNSCIFLLHHAINRDLAH
jgi:hypothetical protein